MGFPDAKWAVDQVVSKLATVPDDMRKFEASVINENTLGLKFLEPEDSYYSVGGAKACVVKGVVIRMSTEGYPVDENDGELVIDNTNLGMYENTQFVVGGLTEDQPYYFAAFPYSTAGAYNNSGHTVNKVIATPKSGEQVLVTVNIDDASTFEGTEITIKNITDDTQEVVDMSGAGSTSFTAVANKTYEVIISEVHGYKVDTLTSGQFVAVAGGSRTVTFNYTRGFKYTILLDNGADGIPSSFTYEDDCAGFTPASVNNMNSWANSEILDFFKPCLIKPGKSEPEYYLYKDNYTIQADGTTPSVLTGNDGDVMIEVDPLWYTVEKTQDSKIRLSIYSYEVPNSKCFNEFDGVVQPKMYRGVYEAYNSSGQMRSISGVAPTVSQTRATFRGQARARGDEYAQNDYGLLLLWQCMYLLLYGTRDSQTAIGKGRSNASNSSAINTGTMNARPFCWGSTNGTDGMKFLGVENFFGNIWEFVDGLTMSGLSGKVTRFRNKYADTFDNTWEKSFTVPSASANYINKVLGTEDLIFIPEAVSGSEATYFCDAFWSATGGCVARFGGSWAYAGEVGAFCLYLHSAASFSYASVSSRLCRKFVAAI